MSNDSFWLMILETNPSWKSRKQRQRVTAFTRARQPLRAWLQRPPHFFLPPTVLSTTKLWLKTYPLIRSERPKTQLDHLLLFINTIKLAIRTTLTLPSVAHVTGYQNGPHTPILGLFRVCKGHTCYRLSERLSHTLPFCQLTSGVQSVLASPL